MLVRETFLSSPGATDANGHGFSRGQRLTSASRKEVFSVSKKHCTHFIFSYKLSLFYISCHEAGFDRIIRSKFLINMPTSTQTPVKCFFLQGTSRLKATTHTKGLLACRSEKLLFLPLEWTLLSPRFLPSLSSFFFRVSLGAYSGQFPLNLFQFISS